MDEKTIPSKEYSEETIEQIKKDFEPIKKLMDELYALNDELKVPGPAAFGINKQRFFEVRHTMAEQALASGSPGNNPRAPSVDEIVVLYEKLWS